MSASISAVKEDLEGDDRWSSIHNRFVNQAHEMEPEVLFIGASIIANFQLTDLWKKWFVPLHSLNFGISGDRTENVLWRLQNGELEYLTPKAIVIQIGSNNTDSSAEEVANAIIEIIKTIKGKQPQAHLIIIPLLPRGHKPNHLRDKNERTNKIVESELKRFEQCEMTSYGDLLQADGTLDHSDMYDYLHPTTEGYRKIFQPVYDTLLDILQQEDFSVLDDSEGNTTTDSLD